MDAQSTTGIPCHSIGLESPMLGRHEESRNKSPIACLSEELLTLILERVRDSLDDPDDPVQVVPVKLPIVASHVSRFWRFVALSNPLWWSNIVIKFPWKIGAVEAYLERSKQCLLSISIFGNVDPHKRDIILPIDTSEDYPRLHALLFPHFPRCRALEIRKIFNEDSAIPLSIVDHFDTLDLPRLEQFVFEGDASYFEHPLCEGASSNLISSAPNLRDLRLIGSGVEQLHMLSHSPSVNPVPLTSLHLSRVSHSHQTTFSELKTVLDACSPLTTLAIYHDVLTEWPGRTSTCNVPSLENLYILGNMFTVSEFLLFLSAPKLKELIIAPVGVHDMDLFLQCESKSLPSANPYHPRFPALRTLTLAPASSRACQVIPMASECFPQIECLILPNFYLFPFIDIFASQETHNIVFPNLMDLALTNVDITYIKAIRDMFRAQQNLPLRTVFVDRASLKRMDIISGPDDGEDTCRYLDVVEGNLWEAQRRRLLYADVKDMFVVQPPPGL